MTNQGRPDDASGTTSQVDGDSTKTAADQEQPRPRGARGNNDDITPTLEERAKQLAVLFGRRVIAKKVSDNVIQWSIHKRDHPEPVEPQDEPSA